MKKIFLLIVLTVFGLSNVNAQSNFNVGINFGLPLGDIKESYNLNIGVDLVYLCDVSEKFKAGVVTGYSHFLGGSIDLGEFGTYEVLNGGFTPFAAAGRFNLLEDFIIGIDIGYAIGVSPRGNDGGFYYAPKLQYRTNETLDIVLAYKAMTKSEGTFGSINLGIEFGL